LQNSRSVRLGEVVNGSLRCLLAAPLLGSSLNLRLREALADFCILRTGHGPSREASPASDRRGPRDGTFSFVEAAGGCFGFECSRLMVAVEHEITSSLSLAVA
jgi:hypothetical protein